MMRKVFLLLLVILSSVFLGGCSAKINNEIKVILPSGTPLIAVGGLLEEENVDYTVVSGADLLTTAMISKSHDIVIAPLTLGMKLFMNESSSYKVYAIITFGNTYLVSRKTTALNSMADVNQQDIMAFGQNNTPDIILKAALEDNKYQANITYQAGVNDIVPFFVCGDGNCEKAPKYILSAEPTITTLELKYGLELNILNLQDVMGEDHEKIPQAALFINPDSPYLEDIEIFMKKLEKNINEMNNKTNAYVDKIIGFHDFFQKTGADVLKRSIPRSNINFLLAEENKEIVVAYCNLLNKYNNKILGGSVVDEEIYYKN
jgi:NitT/TauT family transport system substrate-binding protein